MGIKKFLLAALSCAAALTVPLSACSESSGLVWGESSRNGNDYYYLSGEIEADEYGRYIIPGSRRGKPVRVTRELTLKPGGDTLIFDEGVFELDWEAFVGADVKTVVLPSTLESISQSAFRSSAVENVVIPEGVKFIEYFAFDNTPVQSLVLPASLERVDMDAFCRTYNLKSVIFKGLKGLLSSWAFENSAVQYVSFPETEFEGLSYRAFEGCNVRYVDLGGCRVIGSEAFANCDFLESITLPATLEHIRCDSFVACDNLGKIVFEDTEDWYAIRFIGSTQEGEYEVLSPVDFSDSVKNVELLSEGEYDYMHLPDYIGGE